MSHYYGGQFRPRVGSDTSSVRSFGSSRGYGSASIGSLKSTFEPSATSGRYGASSYDPGGGGGGAYRSSSAARRPSMDRSLSYASLNAGAVSSVKSKFDPKPSSAPSREGYSSVDRFSGHSSGDYVTRSGGGGGGYGSDLDVGSMRSYSSYGRSPSSSRGYYGRDYSARESSREPSPTRHGSRLSRTDYEHATLMRSSYGGRDYTTGIDKSYDSGKSYGSGSKYGGGGYSFGTSYVPDYKSKSSVLTPFEPRRQTVTKTAEPSLTPFGKRFGRSISQLEAHSPRSYERQNSERSIKSPERPALLSPRSVPKDDTVQKDTEQRKKRWIPDEELSSDSCEEPTDYRRRNPNVIYMTNRATSPMEIDREGLLDEISKYQRQRRKRLISRTKTKEYARKNYKRRRDKPNICDVCFQVDTEEMDRLSGRVRYIRNKFRDKLQENRNNSYSYGNSQSRPSSGYSSYAPKPDKVARSPSSDQTKDKHSGVPEPDSQRRNRQQGPLSPKQTEPLPKQSAFRKLDRPKRQNEERVDFYQSDVLTDLETHQGSQWEEDDDDDIPQQTSFLDRKRQSEEQPGTTEEVAPLTPENLSLKETIDKVKCWKKQLQQTPPESPIPPAQKESLSPRDRRASKPPKGPSKTPYKYKEQDEDNEYFSDECVEDFANRPKPPIPYQRGQPSRSNSYQSKKDSQPSYHDESSVYDYDTSNSAYGIVSAPKIFIYESDPPYYSNKNLHHLAPADSMASLGDESSMVSDDEPIINRTQSMASLGTFPRRGRNNRAMSMDSLNRFDKSTSVTSLPDLIENKQRSGPYISHSIKDIDSFLDFDETEDDPDLWSDDEVEQMRKNKENYNKAMTRLSSPEEMEEESIPELEIETEAKQIANKRKACLPSWMKVILPRRKKAEKKDKYISDVTNIDDYFDPDINENVGKFNRSESLDARSPLHLDIPTSPGTENFGSCGSILDTPVPETPDVPLAPKPVFGFPKTVEESKPNSQSLDNLEALDPDGKLSLKRLAKKEKNLDKTRSVGNLDDLDSILNTLSSTPPSRRKKRMRDESSTFNLFCKDAKEDLIKEADDNLVSPEHSTRPELITQKSEDILVDVSDVTDQAVASNLVRNEDGTYPADYSAEAVRQAILLELVKGTISTAELLDFCKLELPKKPPWVVADEDRCFAGFSNMDGLLEAFGVDVKKLEDCALQLYKYNNGQGDYGTYLDLESSLEEQYDDIEGFSDCKKNAIILRTLLSVRVHACIEKLLISTGRELRRALFSLKQIFQDDKDLVHEFVNNDGLECLIKVGSEADQNYQNYILRALGQVMLYVDGMNGVIAHNETVQWLYSLTASKFRLVVKTALKLLLVFVDYTEPNTLLLLQAINTVDRARGEHPWCNIMNILNEKDGGDTELLVYAMTLISKALNAVADQDTFYDVTDVLEEQGMEHIIRRHMTRQNADLDLLEQFQVYEAVLRAEDGLDNGEGGHTDSLRKMKRKQSENESRKSRRYSAENSNNAERMRHTPSPLPPTLEVSEPRNSEPTDAAGTAPTSICSQPLRRRERPEYSDEPEPPWWRAGSTGGDSGGSTTPQALSPRQQMNGHSPQQSTASPEAPSMTVPTTNYRRRRRDRHVSMAAEQEALTKELRNRFGDNSEEAADHLKNMSQSNNSAASSSDSSMYESANDVTPKSSSTTSMPPGRRRFSRQDTNPSLVRQNTREALLSRQETNPSLNNNLPASAPTDNAPNQSRSEADITSPRRKYTGSSSSAVFPKPFASKSESGTNNSIVTHSSTNSIPRTNGSTTTTTIATHTVSSESPESTENETNPNNNYIVQSSQEGSFLEKDGRFIGSRVYRRQTTLSDLETENLSRQSYRADLLSNEQTEESGKSKLGVISMFNNNDNSELVTSASLKDIESDKGVGKCTRTYYPARVPGCPNSTGMPSQQDPLSPTSVESHESNALSPTSHLLPSSTIMTSGGNQRTRRRYEEDSRPEAFVTAISIDTVVFSNKQAQDGDTISLASTVSTLSSVSATTDSTNDTGATILRQSMGSLSDLEHRDLDLTSEDEKAGRRRRQPRSGAESTQHAHQASSESGELEGGVLPPANISNNRRWLLYKQKKSQEGLEVPGAEEEGEGAGHQKRLSADGGESLASRLDSLHQQQERDAENHGAGSRGAVPSELTNSVQAAQEKLRGTAELNSNASKEAKQDLGFSGLISKAKDGLSSSSTRAFERPKAAPEPVVVKKTDSELQWEEIEKSLERELKIQGYDFSDLTKADEINLLEVPQHTALGGGPPPPPPLGYGFGAVPPPPPAFPGAPPPPPPVPVVPAPPPPPGGLVPPPPSLSGSASDLNTLGKNKKTVKLHWKEATTEFQLPSGRQMDTIWKRMNREYHLIKIDTEKLEHLFETRTSEVKQKKQEGAKKEIIVLDPRRSNAINIGLTVLPPKGTIKTAILKMDTSILNRECIEKILTIMLPTEEEKNKILECQMANPGVPLGNAEQFLLSLSTISELEARLRLWAFKLDYDGCESEVAEPLNDLKQGMEDLRNNKTFKFILALLLSIGNFLNGAQAKGFTVEYLARVPEVKDTVHKHSLLHHLCNMVVDQCPGSTDLYSELGAVARCSKVDFDELADKLAKMEADCKASWDHLRSIAKHDVTYNMRNKLPEFLTDSAERIILLKIIHKRILNRFYKFMLFLGYPVNLAKDVKVHAFCKVVTEFALEYKTTRDKVLQMREKKANARERKKTRGKMIVETENFSGVSSSPRPADPEKNEDDKLKRLLHNGYASQDDGSSSRLPGTHVRKRYSLDKGQQPRRMGLGSGRAKGSDSESVYDTADDDVLDSVLRSAVTSGAPARTRQRTRARNKDRKSLRRTLKNGLSKEDIEALNETYSKTAQSGAT